MNILKGGLALVMILAISTVTQSGCALRENSLNGQSIKYGHGADGESILNMLRYEDHLIDLSKSSLMNEYLRVNKLYGEGKTADTIMKMVILLSLPNTFYHDDLKALEILRQNLNKQEGVGWKNKEYARHMERVLHNRLRISNNLTLVTEELQLERSECNGLRKKLEELTKIEKSMMNRQNIPEVKSQ